MIEEAIDALHTYLEANMADKVAAINLAREEDFVLEDIVGWYPGGWPDSGTAPPYIVIEPMPSGFEVVEEWGASDQLLGKSLLQVVAVVGESDGPTRFRRLARYAKAIFQLTHAWEQGDEDEYIVSWEGPWRFTTAFPEEEPFLQGVSVPVQLQKVEAIS